MYTQSMFETKVLKYIYIYIYKIELNFQFVQLRKILYIAQGLGKYILGSWGERSFLIQGAKTPPGRALLFV